MSSSNGTVVKDLTYNPKVKGSNPTVSTGREKMLKLKVLLNLFESMNDEWLHFLIISGYVLCRGIIDELLLV
jgi:hypothetical protein